MSDRPPYRRVIRLDRRDYVSKFTGLSLSPDLMMEVEVLECGHDGRSRLRHAAEPYPRQTVQRRRCPSCHGVPLGAPGVPPTDAARDARATGGDSTGAAAVDSAP